jgi:hypothetical protein
LEIDLAAATQSIIDSKIVSGLVSGDILVLGDGLGVTFSVSGSILGPTGPQGPIGPQGATGADGTIGVDGATGATGPQGDIGPQGATGADGTIGVDGATGATGPQGPIGPTGATGSLPDNFEGFITGATAIGLLEDDNNWTTGGQYIGATAIDGTFQGQQYHDSVNDYMFIAVDDNVWIRTETGDMIAGPTGPQGVQGAIGPTGPQGPQGPIGATGADSTVPGPTGATGSLLEDSFDGFLTGATAISL